MRKFWSVTRVACMLLATGGLLSACGGEGTECGLGTQDVDGKCVPECPVTQYWDGTICKDLPTSGCDEGTKLNPETGKCEPDSGACAAGTEFSETTGKCEPVCTGTEYWDGTQCKLVPVCGDGTEFNALTGQCEPMVTCGEGTHVDTETGTCVPDRLPPPDIFENEEAIPVFELPEVGGSVTLGGVIDTPKVAEDGSKVGDWDEFIFESTNGHEYIHVSATSEGATLPAFILQGILPETFGEDPSKWEVFYTRYAINPNAVDCERDFYLPRDGVYLLTVTDYNHLVGALFDYFGDPHVPVGGPDFTYYVKVENLPMPTPVEIDGANLPVDQTGKFGAGKLGFFSLKNLTNGDLLKAVSVAQPVVDVPSDFFMALTMFDAEGNYISEAASYSMGADSGLFFLASGDYMVVQDFILAIGPNDDFLVKMEKKEALDCTTQDCSTLTLEEGGENIIIAQMKKFEVFFHSATVLDEYSALVVEIFNTNGVKIVEDQFSYYDGWYGMILPTAFLAIPTEDSAVIIRMTEYYSAAIEYQQSMFSVPETLLQEGNNANLTVSDFPAFTYWDAGITQFITTEPNKLVITQNYQFSIEPIQPIPLIMNMNQENIFALTEAGDPVQPAMALLANADRYLHWLIDYDPYEEGSFKDTTYSFDLGYVDIMASPGTPTNEAAVEFTTSPVDATVKATAAYVTVVENQRYTVTVSESAAPTELAIMPEVQVFYFATTDGYDLFPDPAGNLLVQMMVKGGAETVITDPFLSSYAGNLLIVVRDPSGAATETTTFDVKVETVKPPENDTCAGAELIAIPSVDGQVVVNGTTAIANADYAGSCAGSGPELVYTFTVENAADFTFETLASETNFKDTTLYLRTTCDTEDSQIACDDDNGEGLLSKISIKLEPGTYFLFMDGSMSSSAGNFTLAVTVAYPHADDTCADPTPVVIPANGGSVTKTGTTAQAADDYVGSCGGTGGSDVVYSITIPATPALQAMNVHIITLATEGQFDTVLYLRTACDTAEPEPACNDDIGAENTLSEINALLEPGTYFLVVDGKNAEAKGNFKVQIDAFYPDF